MNKRSKGYIIFFIAILSGGLVTCKKKTVEPELPPELPERNVHSGVISSDETWYTSNNPHTVVDDVYVLSDSGVTLTLEPGVLVEFSHEAGLHIGGDDYYDYDPGYGTLIAKGTAEKPIVFTSIALSPQPGDWRGIEFHEGARHNSILDNCVIEYGGWSDWWISGSNISVENTSVTIRNSIIRKSESYGIWAEDGSLIDFSGNTISENGSYPICIGAEHVHEILEGNNLSGNETDGVLVYWGVIRDTVTWRNLGVPYLVDEITLESPLGAALTIEPGCVLKFFINASLRIGGGYDDIGTLIANGTLQEPIIFTSSALAPEPGDWWGIVFRGGTRTSTILNNCIIEYGGHRNYDGTGGNIFVADCSPTITNSIIRNSSTCGIYIASGSPIISDNSFSNNAEGDICTP